jgi:phosphoribosylformylglycinamidine cyclo-ligase
MNLDDMACVGCVNDIILSSTIGRNKNLIPAEVIAAIIQFATRFVDRMAGHGIQLHLAGGETADVGDIVRTIDVGYTAFARMPRQDLIINNIQEGDVIVGLASYGQATYESAYNGGMGSNGLTSARHDVFSKAYKTLYPDSFDPNTPDEVIYIGSKKLTDKIEVEDGVFVDAGKLVLSPTRTYLPVIKVILDVLKPAIHGMIHNTGGGLTKVVKFIKDKKVIKDKLLPLPPLFSMIKAESGTDWQEMYQVFNMGQRLEVYLPASKAQEVIDIARSFNIAAQVIGRVEAGEGEEVVISNEFGTYTYR